MEQLDPVQYLGQYWSEEKVMSHFGYSRQTLEEYNIGVKGDGFDRYAIEYHLVQNSKIWSVKVASAKMGITEQSISTLISLAKTFTVPFPARERGGEWLIHGNQVNQWMDDVVQYNGIYNSISHKVNKFVEKCNIYLNNQKIEILEDSVTKELGYVFDSMSEYRIQYPVVAINHCVISDKPIALPYSENIRYNQRNMKPISLAMDRAGWNTLIEYPELEMHVLGFDKNFQNFKNTHKEMWQTR